LFHWTRIRADVGYLLKLVRRNQAELMSRGSDGFNSLQRIVWQKNSLHIALPGGLFCLSACFGQGSIPVFPIRIALGQSKWPVGQAHRN